VRTKQQHRLYRDAQNDYWEARARRARRVLAARKAARTTLLILIVVVVLGVAAVILNGKGGSVIQRAEGLVHLGGHAIKPEQEVEDLISQAPGASVYTAAPKSIVAMYQPGDGSDYIAVCMDPQGTDNDASGVVSMAEIGGWDCMLVNDLLGAYARPLPIAVLCELLAAPRAG
jgi:hypothetical protein